MGNNEDSDYDIPALDRIYDGLETFTTRKADMQTYDDKVKPGDIVLLEMAVTRWAATAKPADNANAGSAKVEVPPKGTWRRWNIDFRYQAMTILYPGSDYWTEPVEDGDGG